MVTIRLVCDSTADSCPEPYITFVRFIHSAVGSCKSSIFLATIYPCHSSVDGHLPSFWLMTTVDASVYQTSFDEHMDSFLLGTYLGVELL